MTGLPRLSECRDCHDPIRFVTMPPGPPGTPRRRMPVNPQPDPQRGNVAAQLRGGELHGFVISQDHRPGPLDTYRFLPHHASCEARKKTPPNREPDPALF